MTTTTYQHHARPNRLTKAQQKAWWAANRDALKGMPAEVQGVTTANVDSEGNPRAPYKARNTYGYNLDEWYRGDWSHKEAPGKAQGYEPKGLPAEVRTVDNNGDLSTEPSDADKARSAKASRQMQEARGVWPTVEPWQHHVKEGRGHTYPHKGEQTWAEVRGDLPLPTWQMVEVPATDAEKREAAKVLAMPQRRLARVTWTSDQKDGLARLLWAARLRYAKQNRNPEKGARVLEAQLGNWKASAQDTWHAYMDLHGMPVINSINGAPNAEDMEEEGEYGKTADPLTEMAWYEALVMAMRTLTDKQREALRERMHGKPQTDRRGEHLKAAQKKMRQALA